MKFHPQNLMELLHLPKSLLTLGREIQAIQAMTITWFPGGPQQESWGSSRVNEKTRLIFSTSHGHSWVDFDDGMVVFGCFYTKNGLWKNPYV